MSTDLLRDFVTRMDDAIAADTGPASRAAAAARHLPDLLADPGFLDDKYRQGSPDRYTQHVVHVHDQGAYSIVALVWLPGQRTPVHDHRCWCVVGVLQGAEREVRYGLVSDGTDEWLAEHEEHRNPPGSVSVLVPPEENIHLVENTCDGTAISIHVYGDDIAACGSSVNRIFDHEVRTEAPANGTRLAWRTGAAR